MRLVLKKELEGAILDVGGGGEGVIGRIYGPRVVAIDNRQEELDEAPGGFEKRLMDAREMAFPPERFDHVTFFYSAMFMSLATLRAGLKPRELRQAEGQFYLRFEK